MGFRAFWRPGSFNPAHRDKMGGPGQSQKQPRTNATAQILKQQKATADGMARYPKKKGGTR